MIKLSNRLKTIGDLILSGKSSYIIDVGCDHALLDIYLLQNNNNLKVIASDIREKPLESAKKNIIKYSFLNKIELLLKDGIKDINKDIDTAVISGMGEETIINILNDGCEELNHINRLVISSNNKYIDIRKKINELGYIINNEIIVYEDGKYYIIMDFIKGKRKYTSRELYFGPILLKNKNELFYKYYNYLKDTKIEILKSIPKDNNRYKELDKEIKLLTEEC